MSGADHGDSLAQRAPLVGVDVPDYREAIVGDTGTVDTSGDVEIWAELVGVGVVVALGGAVVAVVVVPVGVVVVPVGAGVAVLVGAVVVVVGAVVVADSEVTVIVDRSAGTVTVLGSAVTGTVGVSVGVMVTVTVDTEVEVAVPGSGTPTVAWIERLTVAEKLALTDASVEFSAGTSGVMAVVGSVAGAVPVPGSVGSGLDWAAPGSVAVSEPAISPGTAISLGATSLGAPDIVFGFVMLVRLRIARWSNAAMVHSPESFARAGGSESARTMIVIPIAAVADAATTAARDMWRRNRSADGPAACRPRHRRIRDRGGSASISGSATRSSLLSSVCI
ncbi:hypothetical protein [Nocardia grenadensis]|uniref:hypothetical protein n=1 Tax=Nocardia grenadensis TaxID=931537 RepID=UPI003D8D8426